MVTDLTDLERLKPKPSNEAIETAKPWKCCELKEPGVSGGKNAE